MSGIRINAAFDSGNIEVLDASSPDDIRLSIRRDNASDFYQWFHFRVQGARDQALRLRLVNAGDSSYTDGWGDYRAVASCDRQHWFRVPTRYEGGELVIEHTPAQDCLYYAYFAPYSFERHQDLIARAAQSDRVRVESLGDTLDGRALDLVQIGTPAPGRKKIWIIARQHPGETMAEWCAEGLLDRLLDRHDPQAARLLERAVVYLVPNMNPDGSVRGNLRTNAAGANLNREWGSASAERSPEVLLVTRRMEETGVDLFMDLHGDEALPCNFIDGQVGAPWADETLQQQERAFKHELLAASADFQLERGYPPGKFGPEAMTTAVFWVGGHFRCLSLLLEMPFKDHDLRPDPLQGWSAERSMRLGRALLDPMLSWLGRQ